MSFYPRNPSYGQKLQTDGSGVVGEAFVAHYKLAAPPLGVANVVHAAVTDNGAQQVITTGITNPTYPRNITATAGGTAGDIKAIAVIIAGTDMNDVAITETLPVFTVNTAGIVVGAKAFKTVTSITIPAHDGTGATTAIGTGALLGLPHKLPVNTVWRAWLNGVIEATPPTVAVSATVLASNTLTLASALDATQVDIEYFVPSGGQ